eukprot:733322-Hanusia_phi.AAC.3
MKKGTDVLDGGEDEQHFFTDLLDEQNIGEMYEIEDQELGDFAADACRDHIDEVLAPIAVMIREVELWQLYGEDSITRIKFDMLQDKVRQSNGWSVPSRAEEEEEVELEELLRTRKELQEVIDAGMPDDEKAGMREVLKVLNEAIDAKMKDV